MKFTKINLDKDNRMITPVRVGLNDGRWFLRIDLWAWGFRVTRK